MRMHLTEARIVQLAGAACVASACGGQPRSVVSYEARDSAGVQIHEYDEAAFAAAPRWTVSAAPVLDVGSGLEDDHRYEFFRIEAVDRLSTASWSF